jgi:hypothetical protein
MMPEKKLISRIDLGRYGIDLRQRRAGGRAYDESFWKCSRSIANE